MKPPPLDQFALLVNRKRRLTIFAGTSPPRLFVAPQRMPDETQERSEHKPIGEDEAGKLIAGDSNWVCLNVHGPVSYLIDAWCERRCLQPLARILPKWPLNGLSDNAHELLGAILAARAVARDAASEFEWDLLTAAESKLREQLRAK